MILKLLGLFKLDVFVLAFRDALLQLVVDAEPQQPVANADTSINDELAMTVETVNQEPVANVDTTINEELEMTVETDHQPAASAVPSESYDHSVGCDKPNTGHGSRRSIRETPKAAEPNRPTSRIRAADISPFPRAEPGLKRIKRSEGGTAVLTSSPYFSALKEKMTAKKPARKEVRAKRCLAQELTHQSPTRQSAEKVKRCAKGNPKRIKTDTVEMSTSKQSKQARNGNDDVNCIYCCENFLNSKSGEKWIQCTACMQWSHCACAGISRRAKTFQCDNCTD